MSLYEGAVKRPIMTSLCFVAVAIFGLFSLSKLPIDLLPDIETNTIMVMTAYPGASAEDIENNVTRPLENTLIFPFRPFFELTDSQIFQNPKAEAYPLK